MSGGEAGRGPVSDQREFPVDVETGRAVSLAVDITEQSIELIQTSPAMEYVGESKYPTKVEKSRSVTMDIQTRSVNQYTEFEATHESFRSRLASNSDTERIALLEIGNSGSVEWHSVGARNTDSLSWTDSVWTSKLSSMPAVLQQREQTSDTYRSYSRRKIRVTRPAIEAVEGRLIVVKWREASGGSEGNSSWREFTPRTAVELSAEPTENN